MDAIDKEPKLNGNKEVSWVVGVLCGIVLIIVLVFAVRRRTELVEANSQIKELQQENQTLTDENKKLNQQISDLQDQYDDLKKEAEESKEKADAYDDASKQVEDFAEGIMKLFPELDSSSAKAE